MGATDLTALSPRYTDEFARSVWTDVMATAYLGLSAVVFLATGLLAWARGPIFQLALCGLAVGTLADAFVQVSAKRQGAEQSRSIRLPFWYSGTRLVGAFLFVAGVFRHSAQVTGAWFLVIAAVCTLVVVGLAGLLEVRANRRQSAAEEAADAAELAAYRRDAGGSPPI